MIYTATVTSKRQITLPVELFKKFNLQKGQKVRLRPRGKELVMSLEVDELHQLMGIVKRPKKYVGVKVDKMIELAKKDYWLKKK